MAFIFFTILVVWLIILQQKINLLENSISTLVKLDKKPQPYMENRPEIKVEKVENKSEEPKLQTESFETIKQESKLDISKIFLGNVFNKIGALAIIIAVVIFIKLVSPYIVITPLVKTYAGFIAGFAMILTALHLRKNENLQNYSEVLLGTGFADLFITTFCAYGMFHVLDTPFTIAIGTLLLISTYIISDKMKTVSMLVIGLIGGYLTPFLSGADMVVSISYLIFLNAISVAYSLRNKNAKIINLINLTLTMFIMAGYTITKPVNFVLPVVLWLVYIVYDMLRDKNDDVNDTAVTWLNYGVLTGFTILTYHGIRSSLEIVFACTALGYLALSAYSRKINFEQYKTYDYYILLNIWFLILFMQYDIHRIFAWTISALVLSLITKKFSLEHLQKFIIGYYYSAFSAVLLAHVDGKHCLTTQYNPIINMRTAIFSVPTLAMFISSYITDKYKDILKFGAIGLVYIFAIAEINSFISNNTALAEFNKTMTYIIIGFIYFLQNRKLYNSTKFQLFNFAGYTAFAIAFLALICNSYTYPDGYMSILNLRFTAYAAAILACIIQAKEYDIFKYLAVFLGFMLCHSESAGIYEMYGNDFQYIISICWVLYSGLITTAGIIKNKDFLKYSGIVLSITAILRIFIYDLANFDGLYKLIVLLVLGVILMFVSYLYSKKKI